ncbi:hypothetical protein ACP70R_049664 [Stipagrostis hirtigluma subsp. patula]
MAGKDNLNYEPPVAEKKAKSPASKNPGTQVWSQNILVNIIKEFSPQQQQAIKDAGFGAMLKIPACNIRRSLCADIAKTFDLETEEFDIHGNKVKITIADVHHILGLPSEGDEIKEAPKRQVPELFHRYKWRNDNKISSVSLKDYFKDNASSDEDFVRIFVLYAIGFFLCPTLQPNVSSDYLGLLENVKEFNNINWCSLVLNVLISSIRTFKEQQHVNLAGSLALLQVWYWEKLYLGHLEPSLWHAGETPAMQYWDEKRALKREQVERKHQFGVGKIVHDIRRPKPFPSPESAAPTSNSVQQLEEVKQSMDSLKLMIIERDHKNYVELKAIKETCQSMSRRLDAFLETHFQSCSQQEISNDTATFEDIDTGLQRGKRNAKKKDKNPDYDFQVHRR